MFRAGILSAFSKHITSNILLAFLAEVNYAFVGECVHTPLPAIRHVEAAYPDGAAMLLHGTILDIINLQENFRSYSTSFLILLCLQIAL